MKNNYILLYIQNGKLPTQTVNFKKKVVKIPFIMCSHFIFAVCIFDYMVIMVTSMEWGFVLDFHFLLYVLQ